MTDSKYLDVHFSTALVTYRPVVRLVTREKEGQNDRSLM
jgi:hypothetical protein